MLIGSGRTHTAFHIAEIFNNTRRHDPTIGNPGHNCPRCRNPLGTGRTPGCAGPVVAACPGLEAVRLTDREPVEPFDEGHPRAATRYGWSLAGSEADLASTTFRDYLPAELWDSDLISGVDRHGARQPRRFKTREAADLALSRAALLYALAEAKRLGLLP